MIVPRDLVFILAERISVSGIITRPMGSYNLPNYLCLTIGSVEEMEMLGETLGRIL